MASATRDTPHSFVVETERCGKLNVYVQGDIETARKGDKPTFLTVHDIGKNHNSWLNFVFHPSMSNVRERAVFIHVALLGQEDEAKDLPGGAAKFPTMQQMGEDMVNVLDYLRVKTVIGLGDGAGANILARFEGMHASRCMGVILINPTATAATFMEQFKDKITSKFPRLKGGSSSSAGISPDMALHRFGYKLEDITDDEELATALDEYKDRIKDSALNQKNVLAYIDAFMARDDITAKVGAYQDDMLLICGAKSAYVPSMEYMFSLCDKTKTSNLKIEGVTDVLEDAPAKLANSLLLFSKGAGWLTSLTTPGVDRQRSMSQSSTGSGAGAGGRRMSMEEYDKPNIRRLSLVGATTTENKEKEKDKEDE